MFILIGVHLQRSGWRITWHYAY